MSLDFDLTVHDNMGAVLDSLAEKAQNVSDSIRDSKANLVEVTKAQTQATKATEDANKALQQQQLNAIGTLTAINTLSSGVRLLSYSILRLDLVSEENRQTVMKLVAAFQLLAGVATIIKSLTLATKAMGVASLQVAVIKTYTALLDAPWKAALVGGILGATAGVATGLMLGGGSTNTTTNSEINIVYGSPSSNQDSNTQIIKNVIEGSKV